MMKILSAILVIAFTTNFLTACENNGLTKEQKQSLEERKKMRGTRNLANE